MKAEDGIVLVKKYGEERSVGKMQTDGLREIVR